MFPGVPSIPHRVLEWLVTCWGCGKLCPWLSSSIYASGGRCAATRHHIASTAGEPTDGVGGLVVLDHVEPLDLVGLVDPEDAESHEGAEQEDAGGRGAGGVGWLVG